MSLAIVGFFLLSVRAESGEVTAVATAAVLYILIEMHSAKTNTPLQASHKLKYEVPLGLSCVVAAT